MADAEFNSEENEDIADGLNKKWEDVLLVYGSAPKSISAGFSAYLFVSDENQIIFGNLKNTRYDDENCPYKKTKSRNHSFINTYDFCFLLKLMTLRKKVHFRMKTPCLSCCTSGSPNYIKNGTSGHKATGRWFEIS